MISPGQNRSESSRHLRESGFEMKNQMSTFAVFLATAVIVMSADADLVMVGPNMQLVSTNAVNADINPSYDVDTAFDGILNSTELNGAVFNLPSQDPSVWTVDFVNVADVDQLMLYQLVGGISDNGIRDFEITFYAGNNASGAILLNQSFSATLNPANTPETFNLASTVSSPESFTLSVSSAYGNESRAEFSEIQFNGNIFAVPEPTSTMWIVFTTAGYCLARRRHA